MLPKPLRLPTRNINSPSTATAEQFLRALQLKNITIIRLVRTKFPQAVQELVMSSSVCIAVLIRTAMTQPSPPPEQQPAIPITSRRTLSSARIAPTTPHGGQRMLPLPSLTIWVMFSKRSPASMTRKRTSLTATGRPMLSSREIPRPEHLTIVSTVTGKLLMQNSIRQTEIRLNIKAYTAPTAKASNSRATPFSRLSMTLPRTATRLSSTAKPETLFQTLTMSTEISRCSRQPQRQPITTSPIPSRAGTGFLTASRRPATS